MKNLNEEQFSELIASISKQKIEIEFDSWDYDDSGNSEGSYTDLDYQLDTKEFLIEIEMDISDTFVIGKGNADPFSFMSNGKGGMCSAKFEFYYGDDEYSFTIEQQIKVSTAVQKIIE
jgi:hypothetical protein